jgi:hypothetical protein
LTSPIQNYTRPEEITPDRLTESKPTSLGPNENSDSDTETEDEDEGTGYYVTIVTTFLIREKGESLSGPRKM